MIEPTPKEEAEQLVVKVVDEHFAITYKVFGVTMPVTAGFPANRLRRAVQLWIEERERRKR